MVNICKPCYVVVEGPIGVGKSTLVEGLARQKSARKILEQFEENPFLEKFYHDQSRYAFQTEMFFLLSRYRQLQDIPQHALFESFTISDYLFVKNRIFASLTLSDEEFLLYDRMYYLLEQQIPKPDVIILLDAPVEVLMERIHKRGRAMEKGITHNYLEMLRYKYIAFFKEYRHAPVWTIDATNFNFAKSAEDLEFVLKLLFDPNNNNENYNDKIPPKYNSIEPKLPIMSAYGT